MPKTLTLTLPVTLTQHELLERGEALALGRVARNETALAAKAKAGEYKQQLEALDEEVDRLAAIVRDKAEPRPVVCELRPDLDRGVMETRRTDTGELVSTRVLEAHERNLELFPEAEERASA